jgi:hypothetical protein
MNWRSRLMVPPIAQAMGVCEEICAEWHKSVKRPQFGSNTKRGNSIAREGRGMRR